MRAAIYRGKGDIRVETVPDPHIVHPSDAIVRVTHACICGSDLWFYRGLENWQPGWKTGHEWIGVVEEVGADVRALRRGDRVIAPFMYSDGSCEFCSAGLTSACRHGGFWGGESMDGGQGEFVRAPFADATLVAFPDVAHDRLRQLAPLTDVLPTGHHAAVSACVGKGTTAIVIGDGAVGLCAVLAARRLGAERIVLVGHQPERLEWARRFGASHVVGSRGAEAIEETLQLTEGGAPSVLECVGTSESLATAIAMARPGGHIGYVGVPHHAEPLDLQPMFLKNVSLNGGVAPVRAYLGELLADVLAGRLDASAVLDRTVTLNGVADGYAAMDQRKAIKVLVEVAA